MKARDVVVVDGVRTAFGRAGEKGYFWHTRADDMVVKVIRELLRRNPKVRPEMVEENVWGATTQEGDQGLTLGRTSAILSGLPESCAGFSVDRMCAGGLTAITTAASEIALGACDVAIAGGVEHMGHHPIGATADPNPRFLTERLVSEDALVMGKTAENLHDMYPGITREMADEYALLSQKKTADGLCARQDSEDDSSNDRLYQGRLDGRRPGPAAAPGHEHGRAQGPQDAFSGTGESDAGQRFGSQ